MKKPNRMDGIAKKARILVETISVNSSTFESDDEKMSIHVSESAEWMDALTSVLRNLLDGVRQEDRKGMTKGICRFLTEYLPEEGTYVQWKE